MFIRWTKLKCDKFPLCTGPTWLKRSDNTLPISLNDTDNFSRRQNVGAPLPLFVVAVGGVVGIVFVVGSCQPIDLAPPLGLGQQLDCHQITIDGPVAKKTSRNQDVLVVRIFESSFGAKTCTN